MSYEHGGCAVPYQHSPAATKQAISRCGQMRMEQCHEFTVVRPRCFVGDRDLPSRVSGIAEAWKWSVTVPVEHVAVTYCELRDAVLGYLSGKHIVCDTISDATAARYVQSLLHNAAKSRRGGKRDDAIAYALRAGVAAFLLVERGERCRERGPDARSAFHAITCRRGSERNCQTITQAYERASASAGALVGPASGGVCDHALAQNVLGQVCLCLYWDDVHILERLRQAACGSGGGARP